MSYDERLKLYKLLTNQPKNIVINNNDCSIVNRTEKSFKINDRKYKNIAKGGSGTIFKVELFINDKKYVFSIKILQIPKQIANISNEENTSVKGWKEVFMLKKSNQFLINKRTQNLPFFYGYNICPIINNNIQYNNFILYNELANGSFMDWIKEKHSSDEWKSFYFQIWSVMRLLQKELKFMHKDLRFDNILYHKINKEQNQIYWKYTIDDTEYYVKNCGYVFILWDFGSWSSLDMLDTLQKSKINLKEYFETNQDLQKINQELYKRIQALQIEDQYTSDELYNILKNKGYENEIKKQMKESNIYIQNNGKKSFRYDYYLHSLLGFIVIENNLYVELYDETEKKLYLPPSDIKIMLDQISEKDSMKNPDYLIDKYLSEYKQVHDYKDEFVI